MIGSQGPKPNKIDDELGIGAGMTKSKIASRLKNRLMSTVYRQTPDNSRDRRFVIEASDPIKSALQRALDHENTKPLHLGLPEDDFPRTEIK